VSTKRRTRPPADPLAALLTAAETTEMSPAARQWFQRLAESEGGPTAGKTAKPPRRKKKSVTTVCQ
jgi:hypothetical protein